MEAHDDLLVFDQYTRRHVVGAWGEVSDERKAEDKAHLEHGGEILPLFTTPKGPLMIVTPGSRRLTRVVLPEEKIDQERNKPDCC